MTDPAIIEAAARRCQFCGAAITDCNGFVNAGEFLLLLQGEQITPREFCGRCDVLMSLEEMREANK